MDSPSIFNLFTQLCQILCKDFNNERVNGPALGHKAVQRFRKQAFEILLFERHEEDEREPLREFQFHQFDMRQNAKTTLDRDRCDQLENCIGNLLNEMEFFRSDSGQSLLMLLLLLKNSINYNVENSVTDIYPFGFFAPLRSCTETNPYIWLSPEILCGIPKKLDVDVQNQYAQGNPYMPNPLMFITPSDPEYQKLDYFFKLDFELPSPRRRPSICAPIQENPPVVDLVKKEDESLLKKTNHKGPLSLSWMNLGKTVSEVGREKPFVSEIPCSLYYLINHIKREQSREEYTLKVVEECTYLMDLKYLCTGVESDSFQFDAENVEFRPKEANLSIKDIGAGSLKAFNEKFIEFGTYFKRLEMATTIIPGSFEMPVTGFVYKSLSKAVNQFLFSIRYFIFNGPKDETILQFSMRMSKVSGIISSLGRLFKVQPDVEHIEEMATGSRLLIYLYDILVDEMYKQDKLITLVMIMRGCCQSYYQLFETWIFNGILTDPYDELFINFTNQYKIRTKYSFEKSFYLQRNEVPAFLRGYENDILLCGKYTMLLREYQPNHKIFSITNPPKLQIHLTYDGIQEVKDVCRAYLKDGYKLCGGRISVRKIFSDMREKKRKLKQTVAIRFKENLVKWREQVDEEKRSIMAEKRKRLVEVQKQIDEKKLIELERRRAEIQLEKDCEEYDHQLEVQDLVKLAEEKKKRIEYYEELNKIANEKKGAIDKTLADLDGQLKDLQSPKKEICNENYKKQLEENMDILNANAEQFVQNKTKVMGSQLANLLDEKLVVKVPSTTKNTTLTEAQKNKLKILSEEFDLKNYENCDNKEKAIVEMGKKILTDAQKNKAKVLAHEFNNNPEPVEEEHVVLVEKSPELTELEKNRFTAMSHHLTDSYFKAQETVTSQKTGPVPVEDLTEMERNRLKIMSHEFGIDVPIEKSLAREINEETMTELQKNRRKVLYGNVTEGDETTNKNLPLNLNQLSDRQKNRQKFYESELGQFLHTPTVPAVIPSPMSMTSDPEVGEKDEKEIIELVDNESKEEEIIENETDESQNGQLVPEIESPVEATPPKRISFMDFLNKSGFECTKIFDGDSTSTGRKEGDSSILPTNTKQELSNLSSLNFESLNQFLQQSLTIPMKTQLELMNNEILKMYLLDLNIYSHFKSMKNYFFLMDGEFGFHICENLISMLESGAKPSALYSYHRLNTILEQAFGASLIGKDKNGARLSFALSTTVTSQEFDLLSPNALKDLELVYDIEWPLNLILCQRTVQQYSSIFQYLLKVRRISWVLENSAYRSLKDSAKTLGNDLLISGQYRHLQLIRHKLAQFVNCLKNHIASSAIQSSWKRFKDELETVTSMMDLQNRHAAYIKQIRFLCMLNRQSVDFQNVINDIFKIILRFNHHLNGDPSKRWHAKEDTEEVRPDVGVNPQATKKKAKRTVYVHPNYEKMCRDEQVFDRLCNYVIYLGEKIVRRGYQVELAEFLNLVNVNGFYKGMQPPRAGDTGALSMERRRGEEIVTLIR